MKKRDRILVQKVIGYIIEIQQYVAGLTAEAFILDRKTVAACAFTVAQIAELAKEISAESQAKYPDIPWNAMRGMRNKIVHDYESLDLSVLWATISKSLPELQTKLTNCLFESADS